MIPHTLGERADDPPSPAHRTRRVGGAGYAAADERANLAISWLRALRCVCSIDNEEECPFIAAFPSEFEIQARYISMSYSGHSKLVEVWNPEQKSFYQARLVDIDEGTGMGVIQFIGSPDPQKIPLNNVRPCQPTETDPSMQYSNQEPVEVAASCTRFHCPPFTFLNSFR